MSSVTTPLCYFSSTDSIPTLKPPPLVRSIFQSPKKPLSLNIRFRQKKLHNMVPMIKRSFGFHEDDELHENSSSLFGEKEEQGEEINSSNILTPSLQPISLTENIDVGSVPKNLHIKSFNGNGIPASLRIIKMKTRLMSSRPEIVPMSLCSSAVKSISSLLLMIDKLLNLVCNGDLITENSLTVSREMSDSLVLLFNQIFAEYPNMFLLILNLLADLIVFTTGKVALDTNHSTDTHQNEKCFDMRRSFYERRIVVDPDNPLILGNYARYLYQNTNDKDRAEEYFARAVRAEPSDAEILSQYGMFLWQQKRDVDAAEEQLLAAIEADPQNGFHKSNYAWFLWISGGSETCFPLNPCT